MISPEKQDRKVSDRTPKRETEQGYRRRVGGSAGRTREAIESDLRRRLTQELGPEICSQILLAVSAGTVLLEGYVADPATRDQVETLVWQVAGVSEVLNHLDLRSA